MNIWHVLFVFLYLVLFWNVILLLNYIIQQQPVIFFFFFALLNHGFACIQYINSSNIMLSLFLFFAFIFIFFFFFLIFVLFLFAAVLACTDAKILLLVHCCSVFSWWIMVAFAYVSYRSLLMGYSSCRIYIYFYYINTYVNHTKNTICQLCMSYNVKQQLKTENSNISALKL